MAQVTETVTRIGEDAAVDLAYGALRLAEGDVAEDVRFDLHRLYRDELTIEEYIQKVLNSQLS